MRNRLKTWLFALLKKDPEAVVVCLRSQDDALSDAIVAEIRRLEPGRRIFEARADEPYAALRARFKKYRIGLLPTMMPIPRVAWLLAPTKILAYNTRLERHHLRPSIASWLFLRGVPLDRIFLRPFGRETVRPRGHRVMEGRPRNPKRKSIAVLTPYFPYPLSHGGAVRMFNLLRETAREFDVVLYAFTEGPVSEPGPVLEFCSRIYLVEKPRYREPRWSTISPPEVGEYESPEMQALWSAREADVAQVEYTYLARYGGDVLVEHDVTFDLYAQIRARRKTFSARWDWWRWHRFETRAVRQFRTVVVMSGKDRDLLQAFLEPRPAGVPMGLRLTDGDEERSRNGEYAANLRPFFRGAVSAEVFTQTRKGWDSVRVIENGVDLARFSPQVEAPGRKLLFIGSFRHFPNIVAFRFLTEEILPLLTDVELTVVAGPDAWLHWTSYTGTLPPATRSGILEFVADVRPLYHDANLVVVPTLESAGTNVKVLEAMAMERAVVSTSSGCAGLGCERGVNIWIADTAQEFADGINRVLENDELRRRIAAAGRQYVEQKFDWRAIGLRQRALLREETGNPIEIRPATRGDLDEIAAIQRASPEASQWEPEGYLEHDCLVAATRGRIVGFLVARTTAPGEREILNVAVEPGFRRQGIGRILLETLLATGRVASFLEVRESNSAAINLYKTLGFSPNGRREKYYHDPGEAAIVMTLFS